MRRRLSTCVLWLVALTWCSRAAAQETAPGAEPVYVMNNSQYYHRADCRRLHFGTAVSLLEASDALPPCPVCQPPPPPPSVRVRRVAPVVTSPPAPPPAKAAAAPAPVAPAAVEPRPDRPGRPGKYRWLGLGIGAGLGFVAGVGVGVNECLFCSNTKFNAILLGFTAGGALGGYALAGGFSDRSEVALERGREAVRRAQSGDPAAPLLAGEPPVLAP